MKRLRESFRLGVFVLAGTRAPDDFKPPYRPLVTFHQFTWGALNTLVGMTSGIFAIFFLRGTVSRWKTVTLIRLPGWRMQAVTLGPVVIGIGELPPDVLDHEMGHWYQSILLGPLYFLVIGLPSVLHALWFQRRYRGHNRHDYYRFYTEAWADAWGGAWDAHRHDISSPGGGDDIS